MQQLNSSIELVEALLKYCFNDKKLLCAAFVHRSFFNENREKIAEHNERLEFLGDSVLGLLVSDYLYIHLPAQAEGQLSQLRAHIVEASTCARFLLKLGLAPYILLGKGEKMNEGRGRETILADLFEAIIGAIYVDGGLAAVREFFLTHFEEDVKALIREPGRNWKADLQDYSQKKFQKPPVYKVLKESGPDHSKQFQVAVYVGDCEVGQGLGSSKKQAEQSAAQDAVHRIGQQKEAEI